MSKQQGQTPDDPEIPIRKKKGKRKGKFELWQRLSPEFLEKRKSSVFHQLGMGNWCRVRTYETKELAEKNKSDFNRKMNLQDEIWWEFEIREQE